MKIQIGKVYRCNNGWKVKCSKFLCDEIYLCEYNGIEYYYTEDGKSFDPFPPNFIDYSKYDIKEEIL